MTGVNRGGGMKGVFGGGGLDSEVHLGLGCV